MPDFIKKMIFPVIKKGSSLFIKMPGAETAELFPLSKDRFFYSEKDVGEYQGKVIRDATGKVKGVVRTIGFRSMTLEKIE